MARESCNLDKDEAEIFKASSSSSPSASPPSPPSSSSSSPPPPPSSTGLLKSCEESTTERRERPEIPAPAMTFTASSSSKLDEESESSKPDEESHTPVRFSKRCSTCRKRSVSPGSGAGAATSSAVATATPMPMNAPSITRPRGGEEIAKANPLIRAAKIIKI